MSAHSAATVIRRRSRSMILFNLIGICLPKYTDKDIHDLTAFLVTVK